MENKETIDLVSVILPVYNTSNKLLHRSVESIACQTYKNLEILLVDDGSSSQECLQALEMLAAEDSRVNVFHKPNGGVSFARNYGLEKARGEFVLFVDPDDELSSNHVLDDAVNCATKENADIVVGAVAYCFKNNVTATPFFNGVFDSTIRMYAEEQSKSFFEYFFAFRYPKTAKFPDSIARSPAAKLYRKKLFNSICFDENIALGEDMICNAELFSRAKGVACINSAWYNYFMYASSASHKHGLEVMDAVAKCCKAARMHLNGFSEKVYLLYCDHLIQSALANILRDGGVSSIKCAKQVINSEFVSLVYSTLVINGFKLSLTDELLIKFLKEKQLLLYVLSIKVGLLLMWLRGKRLIGKE